MAFWKRAALMLFVAAVQALYFPINRGMQGGVMLTTPLDSYLPFWPIWVVPYVGTWLIWAACGFWAVWKMDVHLFKAASVGLLAVVVVGLAWFVLYPTYVQRPALVGDAWEVEWLRFVYRNDRVYNAFPSGHVYITTLIALFWSRWYPRYRWLWLAVVVVVALSTLFTRQHYVLDPLGGLALGWLGYHFGLWVIGDKASGAYRRIAKESGR